MLICLARRANPSLSLCLQQTKMHLPDIKFHMHINHGATFVQNHRPFIFSFCALFLHQNLWLWDAFHSALVNCQVQQLSLIVGLEFCYGLCKQDLLPRPQQHPYFCNSYQSEKEGTFLFWILKSGHSEPEKSYNWKWVGSRFKKNYSTPTPSPTLSKINK